MPETRPARKIEAAIARLGERFGDQVSTAAVIREHHGQDESWHPAHPPDAVLFAESTQDVVAAVEICGEYRCPLIPWGAGTSLEGHIAALEGGVTLDLSRMDRILAVHPDDLDCRVEAGVTRSRLDRALDDHGLFFPIDPGADATIGGMAATRASGTTAVRYGTLRDAVLGLTVVTADGRVVHTGGRARKSSAGYDLTRLFVGSEGTLGVITEVQLRLWGRPEAVAAAVCPFDTLDGAVRTAIAVVQWGIPVARMELLDETMIDAVNRYSRRHDPLRPTLFFELHGSDASVREHMASLAEITAEHGGGAFDWSTRAEDREALWHARHHAWFAALALRPDAKGLPTDVCVPISRLADVIRETRVDVEREGVLAPLVGHVGDGNFHLLLIFDPDDPAELARVRRVNERLIGRALAAGGTCTGEHGVGYGKIEHVEREHGEAIDLMRRIRDAFDPDGLFNPGKMLR
ncbi:MAG: FAD-linked oxidase C-terminal domain-containing protein [Acidobacteriota bacterium]